jgi:XTP/dITP diphosphohydrolase
MKLLIGTNNKHKLKEIRSIFDVEMPGRYELLSIAEALGRDIDIEETGATLEENAFIKAKALFDITGIPCISDDTGLEIDALGGKPGVHSARFSGEYGNDAANRAKALDLLKDIPPEKRTARFRTVICYIDKDKTKYIDGKVEGTIIYEERGSAGFGYDPIFQPLGFYSTFAEMTDAGKNGISHRGNAIRNLVEWMKGGKD